MIVLDSIWPIFMPGMPGTYSAREMRASTWSLLSGARGVAQKNMAQNEARKIFIPASVTVGAVMPSTEKGPERR